MKPSKHQIKRQREIAVGRHPDSGQEGCWQKRKERKIHPVNRHRNTQGTATWDQAMYSGDNQPQSPRWPRGQHCPLRSGHSEAKVLTKTETRQQAVSIPGNRTGPSGDSVPMRSKSPNNKQTPKSDHFLLGICPEEIIRGVCKKVHNKQYSLVQPSELGRCLPRVRPALSTLHVGPCQCSAQRRHRRWLCYDPSTSGEETEAQKISPLPTRSLPLLSSWGAPGEQSPSAAWRSPALNRAQRLRLRSSLAKTPGRRAKPETVPNIHSQGHRGCTDTARMCF